MPIDKNKKDKIVQVLQERKAIKPCHRCGEGKFTILDGFSKIYLDKEIKGGLNIGGPFVPVLFVACDNCGAITSHALGALGLLPKVEEAKKEEMEKEKEEI